LRTRHGRQGHPEPTAALSVSNFRLIGRQGIPNWGMRPERSSAFIVVASRTADRRFRFVGGVHRRLYLIRQSWTRTLALGNSCHLEDQLRCRLSCADPRSLFKADGHDGRTPGKRYSRPIGSTSSY
jgi:hypothetical protein